ncbi:MAG: 50S ribosomal protein L19e [Candidatus Hodarchaeales archaeon]
MNYTPQKRLAAEILGVGVHRVWIDPDVEEDLSLALTREDVRKLIADRVIRKKPMIGVSRGRARILSIQKKRGTKELWIAKIRSQRRYLRGLRNNQLITPAHYRQLYAKAKGNSYRSVTHLRNTITELGMIKKSKTKRR